MQLRDTHDSLVKNDTSGSNSVRVDAKFTDRKGEVLSYPLIVEQSGDTVGVLTTALGNMRDAYLKGAAGAAITVRFQL
ncbi:hypothetical protein GQ42DRAFT_164868 [Ramicandelaber brevisporus]|nr:hypothetical protein GQ42DRAFT_164868 [Ramicandelaber brevisporus]